MPSWTGDMILDRSPFRPLAFIVTAFFFVACASSTTGPSGPGADPEKDSGAPPRDSGATETDAGTTVLTGTLGSLGPVQPTVSSLWISNSGETLVYLSSAALTCDQLKTSRWLGSATAGSQVIEIVVKGAPKLSNYAVPPGEVNFAQGGKSSSYETNADSGTIVFTQADAQVVEGTVSAAYGSNAIHGTFHAEFCTGGQNY